MGHALSASTRSIRRLVLVASAVAAGACGTSPPPPGGGPFSGAGMATEVRLRVRNDNFYDATLTALSDSGRRRVGTVGGNQTAVFTLPWTFSSGLQVIVDLLAGPTCTTDPITVNPGDTVELVILNSTSGFCR